MGKNKVPEWGEWQRAALSQEEVEQVIDQLGVAAAEALAKEQIFVNNLYQVNVNVQDTDPPIAWLSVKRRDKKCIRDWRHLQRIKNEIIGPECEGIELYPAESRLHDTVNQFHLFVVCDSSFRFPFGFTGRIVSEHSEGGRQNHHRQRAFPRDAKPGDLLSADELKERGGLVSVVRADLNEIQKIAGDTTLSQ